MNSTPRTDGEERTAGSLHPKTPVVLSGVARRIESELADLAAWKQEHLTVESWWQEIDTFIRSHPDALLGESVAKIALRWLKERDTLAKENQSMNLEIQRLGMECVLLRIAKAEAILRAK